MVLPQITFAPGGMLLCALSSLWQISVRMQRMAEELEREPLAKVQRTVVSYNSSADGPLEFPVNAVSWRKK
jgi:hypothetical protein